MRNNIFNFQQIEDKIYLGESLRQELYEFIIIKFQQKDLKYNISFDKSPNYNKNDLSRKFTLKVRSVSITENTLTKELMIFENEVIILLDT